jgi:RNA polymerase sigma-70 factor (ECF subfamily)
MRHISAGSSNLNNMGDTGLDATALARAYSLHGRGVLRFLARRTFDAEVAIDLTAEVFARAVEGRGRFHGSVDADVERWLFAIAHHVLVDYIRRGAVERRALRRLGVSPPGADDADLVRVEELAGFEGLRARVVDGLAGLTGAQRTAVSLRVVDELPYSEVARRMGVSEQAARAQVSRGLRALAERLDGTVAVVVEEVRGS